MKIDKIKFYVDNTFNSIFINCDAGIFVVNSEYESVITDKLISIKKKNDRLIFLEMLQIKFSKIAINPRLIDFMVNYYQDEEKAMDSFLKISKVIKFIVFEIEKIDFKLFRKNVKGNLNHYFYKESIDDFIHIEFKLLISSKLNKDLKWLSSKIELSTLINTMVKEGYLKKIINNKLFPNYNYYKEIRLFFEKRYSISIEKEFQKNRREKYKPFDLEFILSN